MIRFNFVVSYPFKSKTFKRIWGKENLLKFLQYKAYNIELSFYICNLFCVCLDLHTTGRDHAGPQLEIVILGLGFRCGIYDTRHWNYQKNCWELNTESKK